MKHNTLIFLPRLFQGIGSLELAFILSFGMIATSCGPGTAQDDKAEQADAPDLVVTKYQNIDVAQFDRLMENKDHIVLDVRTPDEIAEGKIGDAIELDYFAPSFDSDLGKLDKGRKYLVYCKAGGRSSKTAQTMVDMGFQHVYNLEGGYTSWYLANPNE